MPDQLKSAKLTAEWEERLGAVERGKLAPEDFMNGITEMLSSLVKTYENVQVETTSPLSQSGREVVGVCPRCGKSVVEGKKSFFCEGYYDKPPCGFALWKNDRFFIGKRKELTPKTAAALLKNGRVHMTGLYSEKKGVTYGATVILEDDGGKFVRYKMEFDNKSTGKKCCLWACVRRSCRAGGRVMPHKLSNLEKETIILYNKAERTASVYTHNGALKHQLLELCRTRPEQVRQTAVNDWGGLTFELPKKWIRVVPPRVLSPAQRAVLDRMNENRRKDCY